VTGGTSLAPLSFTLTSAPNATALINAPTATATPRTECLVLFIVLLPITNFARESNTAQTARAAWENSQHSA
jgi:hypothetical protein